MKMNFKLTGGIFLGALLLAGMAITSCKDDDDNGGNNDGKVDPATIATSNLVAYFPFDGNGTEKIANLTPSAQASVTYVAGRRGQAYQGAEGAHLLYDLPSASKMKMLTSFSVAMWLKSPLVTGDPEPTIFEIGKSDDLNWGNLKIILNRLGATADSLQLHTYFFKNGVEWAPQHIDFPSKLFMINTWMHIVLEYDEATSKYMIFKDGVKVVPKNGVENRWAGPGETTPLGALAFTNADKINIGAWRNKTEGTATDAWMGYYMGNIDELRVYDKALTAAEAKNLYDAEVSQIAE